MEISKYKRVELDYAKIKWEALQNKQNFPKSLSVDQGHSTIYQLSPEWFFKRKQQDGNHGLNSEGYGIHSQHHFRYDEIVGSFDDLAEVLSAEIAKGLGTVTKTDYLGNKFTSPVIDTAEYKLAVYTNKDGEEERGCLSKNIVADGGNLIQGTYFLQTLPTATATRTPENSLPNYLHALKEYSERTGVVLDPNIQRDLIVNSYYCWKVANCDNHCNNITFIQKKGPDGRSYVTVSPIIDNGSAWESAISYINANGQNRYELIYKAQTGKDSISPQEASEVVFTSNPFYDHTAFKLNGGNLNNHAKTLNGEQLSYEYDLAAFALANPEVYSSIYQIESNFNIDGAIEQVTQDYNLNAPPYYFETVRATTQYKSQVLSQVVSDYYCHVAYTNCVENVDMSNPSEMYLSFQQQMQQLPLQPSAQAYAEEFLKIAKQNNVAINEEALSNLDFLPSPEPAQGVGQSCDVVQ